MVRVLTSATAFHSSVASFQMATDHEEAQANAAAALASLSATAGNHVSHSQPQQRLVNNYEGLAFLPHTNLPIYESSVAQEKILKAGGLAPLVLLLSAESSALQTSAAKCLCNLAADADIAEHIADSNATDLLLKMLESEDQTTQAAAAPALGAIVTSERVAAFAIPHLVKLMTAEIAEVCHAYKVSSCMLPH